MIRVLTAAQLAALTANDADEHRDPHSTPATAQTPVRRGPTP
jgi:hypothetical protein